MSSSAEVGDVVRPLRPVPVIIAVLILADIVSAFEGSMMFLAIPRLVEDFASNTADVSWVLTAFLLVAAASAAICGRLGDIYGRRRLLVVVLVASAVGSVVSIASGSLLGVIIGRAIQGVSGGILPLCFGLAREHLPAKRVPVAIAWIAGAALLAAALGSLVSGILLDRLDWPYIFVVTTVIAVLAAAACLALPRSRVIAAVERVDWIGGLLFAPAIALVLLGVNKSAVWTWLDARTIGSIVGGLALLAVWVWWELRVTSPMINIRLFFERKLALTILATVFLAIGPIGTLGVLLPLIYLNPTDAPVGLGLTATIAGAIGFGVTILAFLLAPISGRIAARAGAQRSLIIGAICGVLAAIGLAALHFTVVGIIIAAATCLIATSFMLTALPNLVVEGVPAENTSEMTGVYIVARTAFTGVGTSIALLLLSLSVVPGTQYGTLGAFNQVFILIGGCCLVGLALALLMNRSRRTTDPAPQPAAAVSEG